MNLFAIIMIILTGFISSLICYVKTKKIFNYGSFYSYIWIAVGCLANSGFMNYYLPSTLVNLCICMSMFVFGLIYAWKGQKSFTNINELLQADCSIRINLIYVFNVFVFIYILPIFFNALNVIRNQGFVYLRMISGTASEDLGITDVHNIILQSVCFPIILASLFIGIVCFFMKTKKAINILVISLINLIMYCFSNASRNGFVIVIIFSFFAYFKLLFPLHKNRIKRSGKSHKFLLSIIIIGLFYVIIYISKERSSSSLTWLENAYIYFMGGPSYLTQLLSHLGDYSINHTFLYGSATFGFIYNIIAMLAKIFGFKIPISDFIINSQLTSNAYAISPTINANAMYTIFFPFLMDWGYVGIILGPFLFALILCYIEKKANSNFDVRWLVLSIYAYYIVYRTIFKYDGISISFFFLLFFIFLFTSTEKNRKFTFGKHTII